MTPYEQALEKLSLSGQLPALGLERTGLLLEKLGNPQTKFPIFHVAGTNGKGSTCAFLESALRQAGYKTGLYTSPHLACARERIQINGELISKELFVSGVEQLPNIEARFFEKFTALAFWCFEQEQVDVAVVEVGLGGRLDSTNTVHPIVCGISRVDLDHQEFLGETLEEIAAEKAGIIKPGVPVCWARQDKMVEGVFVRHCERSEAVYKPWIAASPLLCLQLGLKGKHQQENADLAYRMLQASGLKISDEAIRIGFERTKWPCRYEWVSWQNKDFIFDGAHNPAAFRVLIENLKQDERLKGLKINFMLGMTKGHNALEMFKILFRAFPDSQIVLGQSSSARAIPVSELNQLAIKAGFLGQSLCREASSKRTTIVTGSLYFAGEIRARILGEPLDEFVYSY